MLKGQASNFYYNKLSKKLYNFPTIVNLIKAYFKTKENHQKYPLKWRETILLYIILENLGKLKLEYFQFIVNKLQKIQQGLIRKY